MNIRQLNEELDKLLNERVITKQEANFIMNKYAEVGKLFYEDMKKILDNEVKEGWDSYDLVKFFKEKNYEVEKSNYGLNYVYVKTNAKVDLPETLKEYEEVTLEVKFIVAGTSFDEKPPHISLAKRVAIREGYRTVTVDTETDEVFMW